MSRSGRHENRQCDRPPGSLALHEAVQPRIDGIGRLKLRSLMLRDDLTGLFNRATTKERLVQEVSRAQRQKDVVSFAIIDLDMFKSVSQPTTEVKSYRPEKLIFILKPH